MAQTPETKVKNWIRKQIEKRYPDRWEDVRHQGRYTKKGKPDLIYCINGIFVAIEAKTDIGTTSRLQKEEIKKIKAAQGIVAVVYGKDIEKMELLYKYIDRRIKNIVL